MMIWALARVNFLDAIPRPKELIMPARLPDEPEGRPGRWSVVVKLLETSTENLAGLTFLVEDAPFYKLSQWAVLDLYDGPRKVATARIVRAVDSALACDLQ